MRIESGTGGQIEAGVNNRHRLLVDAESNQIQHIASFIDKNAFQVIGTAAITASGVTTLFIKNDSPTHNMVVTYMRIQIPAYAGGTAFSNVNNYWSIVRNPTYVSGGSVVEPVNVNFSAINIHDLTMYGGDPVLSGGDEFDRYYPLGSEMLVFNKEGAVVLDQNDSLGLTLITDHTSGLAYSRVSFFMKDKKI